MVLSYYNPFKGSIVQQGQNVGRLLTAGKLTEGAYNAINFAQKNKFMPRSRSGSYVKSKRRKGARKTKVATVAAVKRMISGVLEKKQKPQQVVSPSMSIDVLYTYNFTAQIVQGTTDGTRVGDQINLGSLEVNLRYETGTIGGAYQLRILIFWSGEEYNPSNNTLTAANFTASQLFLPGVSGLIPFAPCNSKAVVLLHDQIMNVDSQIEGKPDVGVSRINIPLKGQTFKFQESGSVYGKTKNLYMVALCTGTVSGAGAFGNVYFQSKLNFMDA